MSGAYTPEDYWNFLKTGRFDKLSRHGLGLLKEYVENLETQLEYAKEYVAPRFKNKEDDTIKKPEDF